MESRHPVMTAECELENDDGKESGAECQPKGEIPNRVATGKSDVGQRSSRRYAFDKGRDSEQQPGDDPSFGNADPKRVAVAYCNDDQRQDRRKCGDDQCEPNERER